MSLNNPKVGMVVVRKASGSMYKIRNVEEGRVFLVPLWSGMGCRATWKTITRLAVDYRLEAEQ